MGSRGIRKYNSVNSLPNLLRSPPTRSKNLPGCRYGWLSDYNRRQVEMLRTWNRLVKLPKDRLKGIYPEFQVIRGFSQKILADLLSYDQIHS